MTDIAPASTAFLLLIGNELLTGKIVDSNGAHAIAKLRAAGVALLGMEIVPDETPRIVDALRRIRRDLRPDLVVTSGGVGPTHDDVTMDAVAMALGRPMVRDAEMAEKLAARYGDGINDDLLRMARVPQGCELVYPDAAAGAFPLFRCDNIWSLPGEPGFFVKKFDWLVGQLAGPGTGTAGRFVSRRVHCNCDEGPIAALLRRLQEQNADSDVLIGSYPRYNEDGSAWWTLVTIDSRDPARADAVLDQLLAFLPAGALNKVERD